MSSPLRFACALFPLAVLFAASLPARGQTRPPSAAEVATSLGFEDAAVRRAKAGEIVSRSIDESSRSEIGAVVAMIVRAPVSQIHARVMGAGFAELDPSLLAHGRIQVPATAASFAGLRIPPAELERLARAEPGTDVNLSSDEITALRAAAPNGQEAVGDAYRGLLAARVEAYRERGLAGIAPYARSGGASTSPADALRAALDAEVTAKKYAPVFYAALASYPKALPPNFEERFFWALVDVQGRPAVVMIHRIVGGREDVTGIAERQFYVSQGYNALQILVGLFPVEGGTAVIYTNRTNSDQAARFGRMAQTIGRRTLVGEVTRFFTAARNAVGG
jgi:hypothetical protein